MFIKWDSFILGAKMYQFASSAGTRCSCYFMAVMMMQHTTFISFKTKSDPDLIIIHSAHHAGIYT